MAGRGRPVRTTPAGGQLSGIGSSSSTSSFGASGFDPAALLRPNTDSLFANLPIRRTLTGGRGLPARSAPMPPPEILETGTEYSQRIRLEAESKAIQSRKKMKLGSLSDQMEADNFAEESGQGGYEPSMVGTTNLEGVSTIMPENQPNLINFESFNLSQNHNISVKSLPIEAHKQEILREIRLNQVTVIEGTTGCGKTTRVPVFIMEDMCNKSEQFNIVVTQPRRIAAVSVAKRVASCGGYNLGGLVGYQIGMDHSCVSNDTHLLYCTTGVLLKRVIHSKKEGRLSLDYTHIIIDEIHERNVETDLLLMILRKYIWEYAPEVKLILMSATFQTKRFVEYFQMKTNDFEIAPIAPQIVTIPQKFKKLHTYYLEEFDGTMDLLKRNEFSKEEPQLLPELYDVCLKIVKNMTALENSTKREMQGRGTFLIFLPGLHEIHELYNRLFEFHKNDQTAKFVLLPLHSSISDDIQRRVFENYPGQRKIILATNIAESSITVPDIEYVIDFCLTKNLVVDKKTNLPTLQLDWCTKASCEQRAGRAGRTCEGRAYRLVYCSFYRSFEDYPKPEILNLPLENCVLSAKVLELGPPKELLALCMDPPNIEDIRTAIVKLKRVGGMTVFDENGKFEREDGTLTAMGRIMEALPIDVNATRLIVLGYICGLVEEAVIMAACLTVNSIFNAQFNEELNFFKSRLTWSDRSFCDLTSYLNAYQAYERFMRMNPSDEKRKDWIRRNYLQPKRLSEVKEKIDDMKLRLKHCGVSTETAPNLKIDPIEKELILKFMMAGAFYPNYFMRQSIDPVACAKQMPERNPFTSVILSGFPSHQGILYAQQVRDLMKPASDMVEMSFEETKAIITFSSEKNTLEEAWFNQNIDFMTQNEVMSADKVRKSFLRETKIKNSVYVAVKMRRACRDSLAIKLVQSESEARRVLETLNRDREQKFLTARKLHSNTFRVPSLLPSPVDILKPKPPKRSRFDIKVVAVEECAHFYAQYADEDTASNLKRIEEAIHQYEGNRIRSPILGMHVLIPVLDRSTGELEFKRAVIVDKDRREQKVLVRKVDFGGKVWTKLSEVVSVDIDHCDPALLLPAQSFECYIAEIKPAIYRNIYGVWEDEATKYFEQILIENRYRFEAEIYSLVGDVFRVRLMTGNRQQVADLLIDKEWAESADESLESSNKYKQIQQLSAQGVDISLLSSDMLTTKSLYDVPLSEITSEELKTGRKVVNLKGPNSPLECRFHSITGNSFHSSITIDGRSVNSVALESEPECDYQRMLVAAVTSFSSESQKVVARETTFLPPIRGLPALVCLTFAPTCEMRCDEKKNLFYGLMCGLGAEKRGDVFVSFDRQADMELPFDVLITMKDLISINIIRYNINCMLEDLTKTRCGLYGNPLYERQSELRASIMALLQRRRMQLPSGYASHMDFKWGVLPPESCKKVEVSIHNPFLALIPIPRAMNDVIDEYINELEGLQNLTDSDFVSRCVTCPLDNEIIRSRDEYLRHKNDKAHIARFNSLLFQKADEENAEIEKKKRKFLEKATIEKKVQDESDDPPQWQFDHEMMDDS